jgi:hypothetical protein
VKSLVEEHILAWELTLSLAEHLELEIGKILVENNQERWFNFQIELDPHHQGVNIELTGPVRIPNKKERKELFNLGFKQIIVTTETGKEKVYKI